MQWMTAFRVNATGQVATAVHFLVSEAWKLFFLHTIDFNIQVTYCVWFIYIMQLHISVERTGGNCFLWTDSFDHLSPYLRFELRGKWT